MQEPDMDMDTHTSNFYRNFAGSTTPTGTLEHAPLNPYKSCGSGVPVSSSGDLGTGTLEHEAGVALFVSTSLLSWATDQPHVFARDVQINDTAYRRLDPEYYAWLRSRMNLAKSAHQAGQIDGGAYEALRAKFNAVHAWAMTQFGELALSEAVRGLDARDYAPPVAEPDTPRRIAPPPDGRPELVALVDDIRDRASALGWTHDSLYASRGSARPTLGRKRGLVCFLRPGDRIGEVTTHSIEIILANGVRQRFYNPIGQF